MSDQTYTPVTLRALIAEARERVAIYAFDIGGSTQLDERETGILNDVVAWYDAHVVPFADAWEKQLEAAKAREKALRELVEAERDLPLKIEPDYNDPRYTEKHERARLARVSANMPLPLAASELPGEEGT